MRLSLVWVILGSFLAAASCGESTPAHKLAKGCSINSDCDSPLVCAFQSCHQQCDASRDCPDSELCVTSVRPHSVCQFPSEASCAYNSQCVTGEVCARDGHCRDQCAADRDCIAGQVCASGACANPDEVASDGTLMANADRDAGAGTACQLSSDCGNTGLICRQGYCGLQCREDIDCVPPDGPGGSCVDNRCVGSGVASGGEAGASPGDAGSSGIGELPLGYGKGCSLPSDCDAPLKCGNSGKCVYQCNAGADCDVAGACCVAHQCTTGSACDAMTSGGGAGGSSSADAGACQPCVSNSTCDDGLYCNGQEQCTLGCCAPALDTPCDSHSACILDSCEEKTKKCSSKVVAAEDGDGDGHLALGCAGGDDCNDADPTVYTGHVETFDGKDNDCNGYIDDWTSEPKGPTSGALATNSTIAYFGVPMGGAPGTWLAAGVNGQNLSVEPLDKQWNAGTAVLSGLPLNKAGWGPTDATSGVDTACFLSGANYQTQAIVVDATGALVKEVVLGSDLRDDLHFGNVVWTGSNYLAGWQSGNSTGFYALVDTAGNLLGSHSVPGATATDGTLVSVAANGTSLAVAWEWVGVISLSILNLAGGVAGTVVISTSQNDAPALYAVAGTPGGYVVLWSHDRATFATDVPALNAQPGTPQTFIADASHVPNYAKGATDGVGAAFLIEYATGAAFGYLNGSLKNPFELSTIAPGATIADIAGGTGGRLGVFYTQNGATHGTQAGYASLTGAACSANANCASGKCKAVVATGPKAYSTCQ
jgi:Putative metal-binding motif